VEADGPGLVALVARDGEVLHRAAYGFADVANKVPLRIEQPFYVASIAKSLTAACAVDLAISGKLHLDDEVMKHVPGLPDHCKGVTLRHLLHHRSGLRDFYELEWLASRRPQDLTTRRVLDLLVRQRATNFAPGADFLYSNTGYLLLAEVIARASGRSLHDYAQERLFAPLSMQASTFRDEQHPTVDGAAVAHHDRAAALEPPLLCGAGGLWTNADDLRAWLVALAGGTWRPEIVRELVTPPALRPDQRLSPQLNPYAGGLLLTRVASEPALLMFGGFGGWQAAALAFAAPKLQVIVLANCDVDALGTARELARGVLGKNEPERPANDARPGFAAYRAADGELLFHATRQSGRSFLTTLGWKVEVARHEGTIRTFDANTEAMAKCLDDGSLELRVGDSAPRRYTPFASPQVAATDADDLAGTWHGDEIDADIVLAAEAGKLRIDSSRMILAIAPFQPLDRDTWVSDTGMQINVQRDAAGKANGLRVSTARARGLAFVRR
jgi:CubicO group peptidase (beta-lactamase class C family)